MQTQTQDNVTKLNPPTVFLRLEQVQERIGLKTTAIYSRVKDGTFPRPVPLGGRTVAWVAAEIEEWMQKRMQEREVAIKESV